MTKFLLAFGLLTTTHSVIWADDLQKAFQVVKQHEKKQNSVFVENGSECQGQEGSYSPLSQRLVIDKNHKVILFSAFNCVGNGVAKYLVLIKKDKYQLIKNFKMADNDFIGDITYLDDRTVVFMGRKWAASDAHCCPSQQAELRFNIDNYKQELTIRE